MIYISGVPVRVSEGWSDRKPYSPRKTNDPAILLYRAERKARAERLKLAQRAQARAGKPKRVLSKDKSLCLREHPRTPDNLYQSTGRDGQITLGCRRCKLERYAAKVAAIKASGAPKRKKRSESYRDSWQGAKPKQEKAA